MLKLAMMQIGDRRRRNRILRAQYRYCSRSLNRLTHAFDSSQADYMGAMNGRFGHFILQMIAPGRRPSDLIGLRACQSGSTPPRAPSLLL
jgi:hypothetical protein